eukprot:gb/GECH01006090.1/.p1 GENE.gb/GECH01006090.1/~~gb/GECH01006090.1/.p1  ORF type:complete len:434 (+),score=102.63 gb/GECH01006090.1/:1-1302(+)
MLRSRSINTTSRQSNLFRSQRHNGHFNLNKTSRNIWSHVPVKPLDNIKALTEQYHKDNSPNKVLLGEGVYKDEQGKPFVLPSVRKAEEVVFNQRYDHEYAPVSGIGTFNKTTQKFALGENSPAIKDNRVATVQALSGTGALRLGAEFLKRFAPEDAAVYLPNPTWANHNPIFQHAGFQLEKYRYFNKETNGFDFAGCLEDIKAAPERSIIVLHACAHNPTGVDPGMEQWKEISQVCKERNHIVFFDNAYQGFASGDPENDAQSFRYFIEDGHMPLITQSYAKNFGLYGERIGALNVVCQDSKVSEAVDSQLKVIIRAMYSNPPLYGARLVSTVLNDSGLKKQWEEDVHTMASRIKGNRKAIVDELKKNGSTRDWSHITNQIGMFAFSGLTPEQVDELREKHHVYMTRDGRISISGINPSNLEYLGKTIHEVTK